MTEPLIYRQIPTQDDMISYAAYENHVVFFHTHHDCTFNGETIHELKSYEKNEKKDFVVFKEKTIPIDTSYGLHHLLKKIVIYNKEFSFDGWSPEKYILTNENGTVSDTVKTLTLVERCIVLLVQYSGRLWTVRISQRKTHKISHHLPKLFRAL